MMEKENEEELKYNEMLKPITYKPEYNRKYKYRHEDLIWRSKYRAMQGRLKSLQRLDLLYGPKQDNKFEKVLPDPKGQEYKVQQISPRELRRRVIENVGLASVFSDDASTKIPSLISSRELVTYHSCRENRQLPITSRSLPDDYRQERVSMSNMNLRNDERFSHFNQAKSPSGTKRKGHNTKADKGTQISFKADRQVQTDYQVPHRDSIDLTDIRESQDVPKLELKAQLDKVDISALDYLDGFDWLPEQDCKKLTGEVYFKPDEEIISSVYVLKSDIPSVQLMNPVTVRIPVKIRFDAEKLLFGIRIKVGLVWRRFEAKFEDTPGSNIFEGYVVFKTEYRGHLFATCNFIQFTYKVGKHGYTFKNALLPDVQVKIKANAVEEPEDITFQVRLVDRERFSKYDDLSSRFIFPVIHVTDGLWIRRNKSLYTRKVAPLLITVSNDTSYDASFGVNCEIYLVREKDDRINIIGERKHIDKNFVVLLDSQHSTFWYAITKNINKYKSHEQILERGFSVALERIAVCKILTFYENKKQYFNIWVCIVEHPDVDDVISKFLNLDGVSGTKKLQMSEHGGISQNIDFTPRSFDINIDLDINFKQKHYKELPTLKFKCGHSCRVRFRAVCRINPLLCDEKEKYGVIQYTDGSKLLHEVRIDTALPVPEYEEIIRPNKPEYSKEAIEKILSVESLHNLAACLTEDEGFDLALRLGLSATTVSKVLVMYGSEESKNFRHFLLWKRDITGEVSDIKNFINAFYDTERGDLALGIMDALENCRPFKN